MRTLNSCCLWCLKCCCSETWTTSRDTWTCQDKSALRADECLIVKTSLTNPTWRHSNTGCNIICSAGGAHTTRIPAFTWLRIKPASASADGCARRPGSLLRFDLCLGDEVGDQWCECVRTGRRWGRQLVSEPCFAALVSTGTTQTVIYAGKYSLEKRKSIHEALDDADTKYSTS